MASAAAPLTAGVSPNAESTTKQRGRVVVSHLAWLLPCLIVWAWFYTSQFEGLVLPDAMDAAQVGRQISEGRGFTTQFLRPLSLAKVGVASRHSDLDNAPLYPLLLGIAFNVARPDDRTVAFVSMAFGFLTALASYFLARRLIGPQGAWLAAVLVALQAELLRVSLSGLNVSLLAFVVTLLFFVTLKHRGTAAWSLLCGAVCALAYLTEYAALALALPALGVLLVGQRAQRLRHAALFVVGFAILAAPWLLRNWAVSGSPFSEMETYSLATYTTTYPEMSLYRKVDPSAGTALSFLAAHPRQVARKLLVNMGSLEASVPPMYGLYLLPLVGLALFLDLGGNGGNRIKWGLVAGVLCLGGVVAAGEPRFELLTALLGVAGAVGASAFFAGLGARGLIGKARAGAAAAVLAVAAFPLALAALLPPAGDPPDRRNLQYLGRVLPEQALVVTDQPWAVAWYSRLPAVWTPEAPVAAPKEGEQLLLSVAADPTRSESFAALERAGVKPDAVFLSAQLPTYTTAQGLGQWQLLHELMREQLTALQHGQATGAAWTPPGWRLAASLPPNEFLLVRGDAPSRPATQGAYGEE